MTRFGNQTAKFYSRSNLLTPLTSSGGQTSRVPVRGTTSAERNAPGRTELFFAADAAVLELAVVGRVCVVTYSDAIAPSVYAGLSFCLPFEIDEVEPQSDGQVRVAGADLLDALKDTQLFEPIGTGINTVSTVAEAVAAPSSTTVAVGAPTNNDSVSMASTSGWWEGDEARITMDDGLGVHVTVVTAVDPPGAPYGNTIQIRDRLPHDASIGNTVEHRRRRVVVASGDGAAFQVGVECRLVMDNGSTHTTLIEEDPDGDAVIMRDGAPAAAAVGKSITATDYSSPTTLDVSVIVGNAPGWAVELESGSYYGTAAGTYHAPQGESVYDLLLQTAQRTGEYFRLKGADFTGLPVRRVVWRRTFDYAGYNGNLRLVKPGADDIDNDALNNNRGIITGTPRRTQVYNPITRIVPYAGDKRITLDLCSEGEKLTALALGYTVVTTGLGLYAPGYVVDMTAESSLGLISRTVTFSEIRVETNKVLEWRSAADSLLKAAVSFLREHGTAARYQYEVPDVVLGVPVYPGQRVEMVYTAADGSWSVNATGGNALYVLSVSRRFDAPQELGGGVLNAGGVPLTTLTLVESPYDIPDHVRAAAGAINEVSRLARQSGGGTAGGGSGATVVTGGGSAADHGGLTGLNDDDHPRYLLADGTRAMTGDLVMGENLRVDGVDLDIHVADPAAHHAPVTAANTGIYIAGQQIGVYLAEPSALEIIDGLRFAPTAAGGGLAIAAQVLSVKLDSNSGLTFGAANGLKIVSPLGISATSTGTVTAVGHSHGAIASAAPGQATSLLKTNDEGHLQLRSFSVGSAGDSQSSVKIMSSDPTWVGLRLKQRGDQVAQMLRIEKNDGSAALLITNDGNLESGSPGFVSGLTGFQIEGTTGNAEFNNVRVRGELHATTFVADELHATGGTMVVATATNVADPTSPAYNKLSAINGITYLVVNASWSSGLSYFSPRDIVRIHSMGEVQNGGSLYIPDIYLEVFDVTSVGDRNLGQGKPGRFILSCYRKSGGYTGYVVPSGSAAVLWTKSGQGAGKYKGSMLLTADLNYAPYLDIFTVDASFTNFTAWPGSGDIRTPPTIKPRVRLGNLDGVLGLPEQWGIAAGTDLSDTSPSAKYLVASDQGVTLHNIDLAMYYGSEELIRLSPEGFRLRAWFSVHTPERAIRWVKASGASVAAMSVRTAGNGLEPYFMEFGLRPTYQSSLVTTGIRIYDNFDQSTVIDLLADYVNVPGYLSSTGLSVEVMDATKGISIGAVGHPSDPPAGVLRFAHRPNNSDVLAINGFGQVWVGPHPTTSGAQTLYVKFANGVVRGIASSV